MKNFLFFIAAALLIASCSNNTEPTPDVTTFTVPKTGSTFTFSSHETDSTETKVAGSDEEFVETVTASGITYGGQSGVWMIEGADAADTTYYCLDANKDVLTTAADMSDLLGDNKWVRYPVTTGTAQKDSGVTTQDFNGIPLQVKSVVTTSKVSEEQLTIGSASVKTVKLKTEVAIKASAFGAVVAEFTITAYTWYAPSLGNMIRRDTPSQKINGSYQNGTYELLKSYTLK